MTFLFSIVRVQTLDVFSYLFILDVYEAVSVTGNPTKIYKHDKFLLEFDLTIANTNPDGVDIPSGVNGLPNFALEVCKYITYWIGIIS